MPLKVMSILSDNNQKNSPDLDKDCLKYLFFLLSYICNERKISNRYLCLNKDNENCTHEISLFPWNTVEKVIN